MNFNTGNKDNVHASLTRQIACTLGQALPSLSFQCYEKNTEANILTLLQIQKYKKKLKIRVDSILIKEIVESATVVKTNIKTK